jgi:hypothetical protein
MAEALHLHEEYTPQLLTLLKPWSHSFFSQNNVKVTRKSSRRALSNGYKVKIQTSGFILYTVILQKKWIANSLRINKTFRIFVVKYT